MKHLPVGLEQGARHNSAPLIVIMPLLDLVALDLVVVRVMALVGGWEGGD